MTFETLALAVFIVALCIFIPNPRDYEQLASRHETSAAEVTGKACWDHHRVDYAFQVGGKSFIGFTNSLQVPCDSIKVGDHIKVFYDPTNPRVSTTMAPQAAYEHYTTQAVGMAIFTLVILGILLRKSFAGRR